MSLENYDNEIRPALAWFCDWTYNDDYDVWYSPDGQGANPDKYFDPLHNATHAWELQKALTEKEMFVRSHKSKIYDKKPYRCSVVFYELPGWAGKSQTVWGEADTPEAALVLAAYDVVRQRDASAG